MVRDLSDISFNDAKKDELLRKALLAGSKLIEAEFCEFTSCSHEDLALDVFQAMCRVDNLRTVSQPSPKHR